MKNILIPTDFSHHSTYAISYVLNLMQDSQTPCRMLLLNTYLIPSTDSSQVIPLNDALKKRSYEGLTNDLKEAQKKLKNPNIIFETTSHIGSLKNVILQLIKRERFDLIAMGKDGGKHVDNISTLLKEEKCPLLITYCEEKTGT